jgi:SAM-dependent methyltransferase
MATVTDYYCSPDLYDILYSDFTADIPFWVAQAKAARGPVLELCCGTGRLLVPCLEAGARIEGLDVSRAMIDQCRAKLARGGHKADVAIGDMRDFTRPHRYALIVIAFNSFLHNATAEDQVATLRCCREHLEPGGRLMFHVFHPDLRKLLENDGTPRHLKTLTLPGGGSMRVTDTGRCDAVEQRVWIARRVEMLDPSGGVTATHDLSFDLRYLWKPETELLLATAGFTRFEARGGFEDPHPPKAGSSLVWTAWRD